MKSTPIVLDSQDSLPEAERRDSLEFPVANSAYSLEIDCNVDFEIVLNSGNLSIVVVLTSWN